MIPRKIDAIMALKKGSQVTVTGDDENGIVEWHDGNPTNITEEQIKSKLTELQAEYDTQDYARKRKAEYPTIEECVHAILDDDLTSLQEKRTIVKNKYPKE
jgi:hypothetical protein